METLITTHAIESYTFGVYCSLCRGGLDMGLILYPCDVRLRYPHDVRLRCYYCDSYCCNYHYRNCSNPVVGILPILRDG